jgi:leucyl/phenylalanyl-tRNA--protein transferase
MQRAYLSLHHAGFCHSIECFDSADALVGGLYGVAVGSSFSAESMFREVTDAGKACLVHLTELVRAQGGKWIDCQQLTPVTAQLGAREIAREHFLELLQNSLSDPPLRF